MIVIPRDIKVTDQEAIRRVLVDQARRGDKSTARTLTKIIIEHLPPLDSVPRPSEASVASPSVDVSPVDATPVSVDGSVVYDASDSQLRSDEDEAPRFNAQQPKPGRRKA